MSELHLKQPLFTNSACGQFTKHRETIKKFTEAGNLKQLYRNKLDKEQRALASMVCDFFDNATASGINVNEQIAEE